jgi:hypothetical protein
LRTRVVEFSSLTDRQTTGTEDEDLLDSLSWSSSDSVGEFSTGHVDGDKSTFSSTVRHRLDEDVKQELGVSRTGSGLGVELNREERLAVLAHPDSLVTAIVGVGEEGFPAVLEAGDIDLVTVVLRGDVTSTRGRTGTRQVHSSISVLHLSSAGAGRESEQLVTETDTKDRDFAGLEDSSEVGDGLFGHGWITWTVRDEKTVVGLSLGADVVVL